MVIIKTTTQKNIGTIPANVKTQIDLLNNVDRKSPLHNADNLLFTDMSGADYY